MSILCKNADCRFLIMFGNDVAGIKNDFQSEPDGMQLNMAEFAKVCRISVIYLACSTVKKRGG